MNKDEIIKLMIDGFIEDMKFMYSNAGISDEESNNHIEQGTVSFELICTNTYQRLLEKGVLKDA
jgi:hypothetical protein